MGGHKRNIAFLLILSLPFYIGSGHVRLFDWDEINFAESAREMLVSGNWLYPQIKFTAFWEKPPLFIWLQAISMKLFGINEFAARLPNAICGTLTLWMLYLTGRKLKDEKFGLIWALVYACSLLPFIYFKSGIIDPVFNLFIFSSYLIFIYAVKNGSGGFKLIILAGFLNGLAVLTKGPVGYLLPALSLFILLFLIPVKFWRSLLVFSVASFFTGISWYLVCIAVNGWSFFMQFIHYQSDLFTKPVAGHSEFVLYHFVVVFLGCFPMAALAVGEMIRIKKVPASFYNLAMFVLFWVVMIVFTIVKTKIIHYSSLAYLPLSWFATLALYKIYDGSQSMSRLSAILYWLSGAFWLLMFFTAALLPWLPVADFVRDTYVRDSLLAAKKDLIPVVAAAIFSIAVITVFICLRNKKVMRALYVQLTGTTVSLLLLLYSIVPFIESISQGDLITKIESFQAQGIPCITSGFKSYAPYYYGEISSSYRDISEQSKPVCVITRKGKPRPDLEKIAATSFESGMYHFYVLK